MALYRMLEIADRDWKLAYQIADAQQRATGHPSAMESVLTVALRAGLRKHAELEGILFQQASEAREVQKTPE